MKLFVRARSLSDMLTNTSLFIKVPLLFMLLSMVVTAQAQYMLNVPAESGLRYRTFTYYYNNAAKLPVDYRKTEEFIQEKGIDTLRTHTEKIKKNGKSKSMYEPIRYIYNEEGKVIKTERFSKKSKDISGYTLISYDKKGRQKEVASYNSDGSLESKQVYVGQDSTRNYRMFCKIDKRGDTTQKSIVQRADTNTHHSTDYYYVKGKLKYQWENDYYPNKSKKRCEFYKKGKLKYVWDYQCKEEGVEVKKRKDTSKVCTSRVWSKDSVLTLVYHTVTAKGIVQKSIEKRNKYNMLLGYKITSGPDDELQYDAYYTYAADGETWLSTDRSWYEKKVVRNSRTTTYDEQGNFISDTQFYYDKNGELTSEYSVAFEYDTNGRPAKRVATSTGTGTKQIDYYAYE